MTTAELPVVDEAATQSPLEVAVQPRTRLQSLDVFRGITIAFMLLVNHPGPGEPYTPLDHAKWDGWTPTDLVFPFFLFIVGVAIPLSFRKRLADPTVSRGSLLGHVWVRALAIVMLGMTLRAVPGLWRPLPQGLRVLPILHVLMYLVAYGGTLMLLIPWRSKALTTWTAPALAVVFTILMLAIYFANNRAVGLGYDWSSLGRGPFRPDQFRIPGVLQRIGIVYGIAATMALFFNWRLILVGAIVLMAAYAAIMLKAPYSGHTTGSLTEQDNLARSIDVAVFDRGVIDENGKTKWVQKHTYGPYPDNEGLLSTIPSIATSLLGILAGLWLMSGRSPLEKCAGMLALSVPVTVLGWLLNWWLMPINKNLWSPSYVVFTAGLAMALLGFLFWMIDVRGRRWWALPFTIFGVNAIAAFALQTLLPHFMNMCRANNPAGGERIGALQYLENGAVAGLHHLNNLVQVHMHWLPTIDRPGNTSIVGSLAYIACVFVLLAVLYVFKIFVKV